MFKLLFAFFLMISSSTHAGSVESIADSLIKKASAAESIEEKVQINTAIIGRIYHSEYNQGKLLAELLLEKSDRSETRLLHGYLLIHTYRFNSYQTGISNLNRAESIAHQLDNEDLLSACYTFKAIVFRDNSMPDSAMTYALMARDIFEKNNKKGELIHNLQMIGDMHYYAGEYDEAEKMYIRVQREQPDFDRSFNYRIIMNNLGLIKTKQRKYDEAENYFFNSLRHLSRPEMTYIDSSGLPYIYRKLMELNILRKRYDQAEKYFTDGVALVKRFTQEIELPGFYIGKAELLYVRKNSDSALAALRFAEELESRYPDIQHRSNISRLYADVYLSLQNYKEASAYLAKHLVAKGTIDSLNNRAKLLHMYAQHNYNTALRRAENLRTERNLSIAVAILILMGLVVNSYYYFRIRKKNRLLMEKNLKLAYLKEPMINSLKIQKQALNTDNITGTEEKPDTEKRLKEPGEELVNRILSDLDKLIYQDKVYLDPNITLGELAERLSTNRNYLLRAIQKKFNVNFVEFMNDFRVKEAIKIMNSEKGQLLTIEGIAADSGFSNRVTFAKVFRDSTGVSPSYFMKNLENTRAEIMV
ncbi:MAG: AraC family transcriptional regulator [Ignavibacteriaceae bacterium]|nr:AraC family transcriptional regulator [Ignavibacteriaceae bacterium]